MDIDKNDFVSMLIEMGHEHAAEFSDKKLLKRAMSLNEESNCPPSPTGKQLFEDIRGAIENGEELALREETESVSETEDQGRPKKKNAEKKAKKDKVSAKSDDEPTTKKHRNHFPLARLAKSKKAKKDKVSAKSKKTSDAPKKKRGRPKGTGKVKREPTGTGVAGPKPGIKAFMIARLSKANEKKPLTREKLHALLVDEFPDRDAEGMRVTVFSQVPTRLIKLDKLKVRGNAEKGFWIQGQASK